MPKLNKTIFKIYCILLCSCLLKTSTGFSQSIEEPGFKDSTTNYIEILGIGSSSSRTPFWIQSNQYGMVSKTSPGGSLRGGLEAFRKLNQSGSWRFGGGVEAAANFTQQGTKVLLPQAYGSLRFKNWELYVGRKKQYLGLADSTLGMGSYIWSGNALPIPRISLGTRGFVNVPFTKGWVSFNSFYSDGLMEKTRAVTSEMKFHQKMFYLRLGKANSLIRLYGGFNHQVEWGGKSPYNTFNGQMPKGFKNYINAVTGKAHTLNPSNFDNTGRVGNHLGTIDLGIEIETYEIAVFMYRQSIYEDGSLIWLGNIKDGLNGLRVHRKNSYGADFEITTFVLEYLYTKNQGGAIVDLDNRLNRGKDDYFNNGQVRDGWSYFNRTIGTPFIPPTSDTKWKWPNYADFFTSNNRVSVLHIGLEGSLFQRIKWTSKLSLSSNAGTYDEPFRGTPSQFSSLLTLQTNLDVLGGILLKGSVAADTGELYPKNFGFTLGLRKNFYP